jgi:hypothetical protein
MTPSHEHKGPIEACQACCATATASAARFAEKIVSLTPHSSEGGGFQASWKRAEAQAEARERLRVANR